ncbi:MAG: hypothetical protein NZ742_01200 [Acidobacteria bacterium]|nr:hypothetical protein [Acidobacteriota bacterium]MDW7983476.1 helix-turn-helix domain-containing protein [Acidobacteriota bacterium]
MTTRPAPTQIRNDSPLWWNPTWRWWWGRGLIGQQASLRPWLPEAVHQEASLWAPPEADEPLPLDVFVLTAHEVHGVPAEATRQFLTAFWVLFDPVEGPAYVRWPNTWFIPWRPEQGIQHPRVIRWIQEVQQGIAVLPERSADPVGSRLTDASSSFATWLATVHSRILSHSGTVVLAEVGSLPFLARTVVSLLAGHPQWNPTEWHVAEPLEVTAPQRERIFEWLKPARGERVTRSLLTLYGQEDRLYTMAQAFRKASNVLWMWLPKPTQMAHTWPDVVRLLRRPPKPIVWTQWAWQRFSSYPWPDDMGAVVQFWDRLIRLTEGGPVLLTTARLQVLLSGRLPMEAPEPLANLIISLIHEYLQSGQTDGLMAEIEGVFERAMLQFATRMFATLPEAARLLGISRTTLLRKLERHGISNPWTAK